MRKQSSKIIFDGKEHCEIVVDGKYHDAMYITDDAGNLTLVWQKLNDEYEWDIVTYLNNGSMYYRDKLYVQVNHCLYAFEMDGNSYYVTRASDRRQYTDSTGNKDAISFFNPYFFQDSYYVLDRNYVFTNSREYSNNYPEMLHVSTKKQWDKKSLDSQGIVVKNMAVANNALRQPRRESGQIVGFNQAFAQMYGLMYCWGNYGGITYKMDYAGNVIQTYDNFEGASFNGALIGAIRNEITGNVVVQKYDGDNFTTLYDTGISIGSLGLRGCGIRQLSNGGIMKVTAGRDEHAENYVITCYITDDYTVEVIGNSTSLFVPIDENTVDKIGNLYFAYTDTSHTSVKYSRDYRVWNDCPLTTMAIGYHPVRGLYYALTNEIVETKDGANFYKFYEFTEATIQNPTEKKYRARFSK